MARTRGPAQWHGSVSLPKAVKDRAQAVADERGSSFADIIREAVVHWLRFMERQRSKAS